MLEISEAAKTITETADPDAKIIFGAVIDEKAKKGEMKITVIATGFGDNYRENLTNQLSLDNKKVPPAIEVEKRRIKKEKKEEEENNITVYKSPLPDQEDEWDVPAFIRKKKE